MSRNRSLRSDAFDCLGEENKQNLGALLHRPTVKAYHCLEHIDCKLITWLTMFCKVGKDPMKSSGKQQQMTEIVARGAMMSIVFGRKGKVSDLSLLKTIDLIDTTQSRHQ
jgi:hypothetical protein